MRTTRPNKQEYYLDIARAVAQRSTCLRAIAGSVIVGNDSAISLAYNGSPRNWSNCLDTQICKRGNECKPGEGIEKCVAVHSEVNAVINAQRNGAIPLIGSKMYLYFKRFDEYLAPYDKPCDNCIKIITQAGIVEVISHIEDKERIKITVSEYKNNIWKTEIINVMKK